MNQVMIDLWPLLVPVLLGTVGWQWRENHQLKVRVAVLETTVENLEVTLSNIQKRQDSQSKKQDDILDRIRSMESEVLKQMGDMNSKVSSLATELKGLHDLLMMSDLGIKTKQQQ